MSATLQPLISALPFRVQQLGLVDYRPVWHEMQAFTDVRDSDTEDEVWCLQHQPVFTLGQNGKAEHILDAGKIPVVKCDRGGQVTYHGPGQLILYLLLDLRRRQIGVKDLVVRIEQAVIDYLATLSVTAERQAGAPGIYVVGEKVAALGLRVRRGCSYHGLSFNVDMDLTPFTRINPCGYAGLMSTDLRSLVSPTPDIIAVQTGLLAQLSRHLETP